MNKIALPFVAIVVLFVSACTTIHPTIASPSEIQRLIIAEGLLAPGDNVQLVTADDAVHKFRITEINLKQGSIYGEQDRVQIEEVVAVQTRDFAAGKTIGLSYGIVVGIASVALAVYAGVWGF